MKNFLLIILCFTLVGFVFSIPLIRLMNSQEGPRKLTELDRNGVINEDAVKRSYPQLADNIRYKLGHYMTETHERWLFACAIASVATNALAVVVVFWERRSAKISHVEGT
jgi:hypothetical protein